MVTRTAPQLPGPAPRRLARRGLRGPLTGLLAALLLLPAMLAAAAVAVRIVARAAVAALRMATAPAPAVAAAPVVRRARYHHADRSLVARSRRPQAEHAGAGRQEWRCPACRLAPRELIPPAYYGESGRRASGSAPRTSG